MISLQHQLQAKQINGLAKISLSQKWCELGQGWDNAEIRKQAFHISQKAKY